MHQLLGRFLLLLTNDHGSNSEIVIGFVPTYGFLHIPIGDSIYIKRWGKVMLTKAENA